MIKQLVQHKKSKREGVIESYWKRKDVSMVRVLTKNGTFIIDEHYTHFDYLTDPKKQGQIIRNGLKEWNKKREKYDLLPLTIPQAFPL